MNKPRLKMVEIYHGKDVRWEGWYNLILDMENPEFNMSIAGPIDPETSSGILTAIKNHEQLLYEWWYVADEERYQLAQYIMSQEQPHKDHACSQCVGDGDLVKEGFVCGYHKAVEVVFNKLGDM